MKAADIVSRIEQRISELGIAPHLASVRKVPSSVEARILLGCNSHSLRLRAGASESELEYELGRLEGFLANTRDQVDLEESIASRPSNESKRITGEANSGGA